MTAPGNTRTLLSAVTQSSGRRQIPPKREGSPVAKPRRRAKFRRMSKVINLNKARKTRDKAEKRASADRNAARHGRSKAEKALDKSVTERAERDLDGHRRDE